MYTSDAQSAIPRGVGHKTQIYIRFVYEQYTKMKEYYYYDYCLPMYIIHWLDTSYIGR